MVDSFGDNITFEERDAPQDIKGQSMMRQLIGWLLIAVVITACSTPPNTSLLATTSTATMPSLPTSTVFPISDATSTQAPLTSATHPIIIESAQLSPTATHPPPVIGLPPEQIKIFQPGPGSQVTSPFQVAGWAGPSYKDRIQLRLLGEDGRVLAQDTAWLHVLPDVGNSGRFYRELPFDIPLVAEAARLEISAHDYQDGQLSHLATLNLTLLSAGRPLVHPAIVGAEKLTIFSHRPETTIEGGRVLVHGAGWVDSDLPLTIEVLDRFGKVLGSTQVNMNAPAIGQLGTFQAEVSYEISFSQWGRIAVIEHSPDIPGMIHFSSVKVWLKP